MKLRYLFLALLLTFSFLLRINNINWDSGAHLHPDERFLTMVATAMKKPASFADYLDPGKSTYNPRRIGYPFYVYGNWPVTLAKVLVAGSSADSYDGFNLFGRSLSAIADTVTVLLVYLVSKLLISILIINKKSKQTTNHELLPYWSALFYGLSVLAIQQAHFFVVDSFLNMFMFASFYFSLCCWGKTANRFRFLANCIASAVFLGMAIGSKVTGLVILPLNISVIILSLFPVDRRSFFKKSSAAIFTVLIYVSATALALRLCSPYYFENGNLADWQIGKEFAANISTLNSFDNPLGWFPPAVQWINKLPVTFAFVNLAVFGWGIPAFGFIVIGLLALFSFIAKTKKHYLLRLLLIAILVWLTAYFLYQSTRFAKTMRYFLPLYPFLAIAGGLGLLHIGRLAGEKIRGPKSRLMAVSLLVLSVFIWPAMFTSIYGKENTRIAATRWIYENVPGNSVVLNEHWDDPLPLGNVSPASQKVYRGLEMPVFNPDSPEKIMLLKERLAEGRYYFITSNRGWGSMMTVPKKYPLTTKFYKDLFAGKLGYVKAAEFTSYPQLCFVYKAGCLAFNDDWSEEAFTVYDHPKVMIFKKNGT